MGRPTMISSTRERDADIPSLAVVSCAGASSCASELSEVELFEAGGRISSDSNADRPGEGDDSATERPLTERDGAAGAEGFLPRASAGDDEGDARCCSSYGGTPFMPSSWKDVGRRPPETDRPELIDRFGSAPGGDASRIVGGGSGSGFLGGWRMKETSLPGMGVVM